MRYFTTLSIACLFSACQQESKTSQSRDVKTKASSKQQQQVSTAQSNTISKQQTTKPVAKKYKQYNAPVTAAQPVAEAQPAQDKPSTAATIRSFITNWRADVIRSGKLQEFVLSAGNAVTVTARQGSTITLNPSDLETIDGRPISGNVKLEVVEMLSVKDMLQMHAPTVSNGQLLETGGSWYINVTANGVPVQLKQGKTFRLSSPGSGDYQVFYGAETSTGTINWQQSNETFTGVGDEVRTQVREGGLRLNMDSNTAFIEGDILRFEPWSVIAGSRVNVDEVLDLTVSTLQRHRFRRLRRDGSGVYKTREVYLADVRMGDKATLEDLLLQSKVVNRTSGLLEGVRPIFLLHCEKGGRLYHLYVDSLAINSTHLSPAVQQELSKKIEAFNIKYWQRMVVIQRSRETTNVLQASLSRFGWINCDRFYNTPGEKINYYTSTSDTTNGYVVVYMLFKGIRSVMQARWQNGDFIFDNIPAGQEVRLIALGADAETSLLGSTPYFKIKKGDPVRVDVQVTEKSKVKEFLERL